MWKQTLAMAALLVMICTVACAPVKTADEPAAESRAEHHHLELSGSYNNPHQIVSYNSASGEFDLYADVSDCLSLELVEDGRLQFSTRLIFVNGHTCMLSGLAEELETGRFVHEHEISDDASCQLIIEVGDNAIVLSDAERGCNYYCGARGSFDGARFSRDSRTEDASSCLIDP